MPMCQLLHQHIPISEAQIFMDNPFPIRNFLWSTARRRRTPNPHQLRNCVLSTSTSCFSQYPKDAHWNRHQQSPCKTLGWYPVVPPKGSIRASGTREFWKFKDSSQLRISQTETDLLSSSTLGSSGLTITELPLHTSGTIASASSYSPSSSPDSSLHGNIALISKVLPSTISSVFFQTTPKRQSDTELAHRRLAWFLQCLQLSIANF